MANSTIEWPLQNPLVQPLYEEYKDAGPTFWLISSALLLNAISIPGIFMNFSIIFVTIKYRSLRSNTSSFLLALTASYECIHAFGHFLFLFLALSGINFIPYSLCFKFLLVPFIANMACICSIAMTGMDRLIQIAFVKTKHNFNHPAYFLLYLAITLGAGSANGYRYWQYSREIPDWPQTGHIGDILPGQYGQWHLVYMIGMNTFSIACYATIWAILRVKTSSEYIHSHLMKSLAVIVGINIGGYFSNAAIRMFLLPLLQLDAIQNWLAYTYLGIFLNLCVTLNAAVLYICSSEYRKCFRAEMNWLFRGNQVQSISPSNLAKNVVVVKGYNHQQQQQRRCTVATNATVDCNNSAVAN